MFLPTTQSNKVGNTDNVESITQVNVPDYTGVNIVCGTIFSMSLVFSILTYVLFERWRKTLFDIKMEELKLR